MDVLHHDSDLERIEVDATFTGGWPREIVRAFRKRMLAIRAASDERVLRAARGNRFKRLKGDRSHQWSLRLNKQWRLIVQLAKGEATTIVHIMGIEDYHA